jgi:hypothetical protein
MTSKEQRRKALEELMKADEQSGLYYIPTGVAFKWWFRGSIVGILAGIAIGWILFT